MISRERGGWNAHGSCIWADIREHIYTEDLNGFFQIFAHTNTYPDYRPIIPEGRKWAMLDCGRAFVIDNDNVLDIMKGES